MKQACEGIMTQAWHSDCARMGRKLDLDLSHGRMFPFHHLLCLFCPPLCFRNWNCLVPFYFLFLISFPSYPSFRDTMLFLYLCFQPSRKNYITKQLLTQGSVLVELFLFLNLGLEQLLFFSIHCHWLHDRGTRRHSVISHKWTATSSGSLQ